MASVVMVPARTRDRVELAADPETLARKRSENRPLGGGDIALEGGQVDRPAMAGPGLPRDAERHHDGRRALALDRLTDAGANLGGSGTRGHSAGGSGLEVRSVVRGGDR